MTAALDSDAIYARGAVLFCWVTASLKDFREVLLITLV